MSALRESANHHVTVPAQRVGRRRAIFSLCLGLRVLGRHPSFEQRNKPCLLEMVVSSQRLIDFALAHDDERNAIGQGPVLVGPVGVELKTTLEQVGIRRDDGNAAI